MASKMHLLFDQDSWQQGQQDYRQQRVNDLDYEEDARQLFGWVKGDGGLEYDVVIHFAKSAAPQIDCSCGQAYCRHGAAILLQCRQQFGNKMLEQLISQSGWSPHAIADEQAKERYIHQLKPWLELLQIALGNAPATTEASFNPEDTFVVAKQDRPEYILWQLNPGQQVLKAHVVRRNRNGELESPRPFIAGDLVLKKEPLECIDCIDQQLFQWAYEHQRLNTAQGIIKLAADDNSNRILKWLCEHQRVYYENPLQPISWCNDPISVNLCWSPHQRHLHPHLRQQYSGAELHAIAASPLLAFSDNEGTEQLSQVAAPLPHFVLLQQLLQAPAIPLAEAQNFTGKIQHITGPQPSVRWPAAPATGQGKPVPVIRLVSSGHLEPAWHNGFIQFEFEYDNWRIDSQAKGNYVLGSTLLWARDLHLEQSYQQQLSEYATLTDTGNWLPVSPKQLHLRHWCTFLLEVIPKLKEQGWIIEQQHDFPLQLLSWQEEDWFAELTPLKNNWFSAEVGLRLEPEPIDLLPLLAAQVEKIPELSELAAMDSNEPILVELPNNQQLALPAGRLQLLMATLLELYDKRRKKAKVKREQLGWLLELESNMPTPWHGKEYLDQFAQQIQLLGEPTKAPTSPDIEGLNARLRPYQCDGVAWLQLLAQNGFSGLLADDMGLGKTLQTLTHLMLTKRQQDEDRPSLVVAPTSLLANWRLEAQRFTPELKVLIYHGADRSQYSTRLAEYDLVITSYGIVNRDLPILAELELSVLVLDESQAIKNPQSSTAKSVRQLQAMQRLALTGTPIENHLGELWAQFDFLMPGFLSSRRQFNRYYRTPIEKQGDQQCQERLRGRITPFLLRRTKALVASELPPKTEIDHPVMLLDSQRELYESIRATTVSQVRQVIADRGLDNARIEVLDALTKLRQICCDPALLKSEHGVTESAKLEELMRLLPLMLEEGRKILLFSQFTSMLAIIESRLKQQGIDYLLLTGKSKNRQRIIERFQQGEVPLFLISLKAGGTGLNLTAADTVIHYDPWWNPAVENQATDRAYRIGQEKPVFVYRLLTENTVEDKIQKLKRRKQELVDGLYDSDGQNQFSLSSEELGWLLDTEEG